MDSNEADKQKLKGKTTPQTGTEHTGRGHIPYTFAQTQTEHR